MVEVVVPAEQRRPLLHQVVSVPVWVLVVLVLVVDQVVKHVVISVEISPLTRSTHQEF